MKNLILMHLESLNNLNYRVNETRFEFLHDFEKKCNRYTNYYSTATSTLMVLSDLQYGSTLRFESCKSLDDVPRQLKDDKSLFDDLSEWGFITKVLVYPASGDISGAEKRFFLGQTVTAKEVPNYDKYLLEIEEVIKQDHFALHVVPTISNVAENKVADVTGCEQSTFWDEGYKILSKICEYVVSKLLELDKMKDTIIVFYGDHGDDYWSHGLHGGLSHAIEPNNLLISTPLFIWTGDDEGKTIDKVVQTTDLKHICLRLIKNEECEIDRTFALSRNMYAGQPLRKETFNKAYSIVDGRYMLIVSNYGLEFYDTVIDPCCSKNLLHFFELKNNILSFNLNYSTDYDFHIKWFFGGRQKRIICERFYFLKECLYEEVLKTYSVPYVESIEKLIEEMDFESIRR